MQIRIVKSGRAFTPYAWSSRDKAWRRLFFVGPLPSMDAGILWARIEYGAYVVSRDRRVAILTNEAATC